MRHHRPGFTRVELLVVITLLVVSIAVALPLLTSRRRATDCRVSNTQVRGIHQSMVMYGQSNGSFYPGFAKDGSLVDASVEHRYQVLLDGNYFTGEYIISPVEALIEWTTGPVSSANYSFAMLDINSTGERAKEWRETLNPDAVLISGRNTGTDAIDNVSSIHSRRLGKWHGEIAWGDNHTSFEKSHIQSTRFGDGQANPADNLFTPVSGDDAYMIHAGD